MPRTRDRALLRAVGRRVSEARKSRGYTQEQLSEVVGIEPVTLSRLETGHRALSLSMLARIAEALGLGLGELLGVERDLPEPEHGPDELELLRLYGRLSPSGKEAVLRLLREMTSTS